MNLKEKMYELLKHVRNNLNDAVGYADGTQKYQDFEDALKQVKIAERRLKAVRAKVRAQMLKTKRALQDSCPHVVKVDTRVHQMIDGTRVVDTQACTACSKTFDLREEVSS